MATKILNHSNKLIHKTLGKQGDQQCGVYSVAYGWTILEGKCRVSGSPASNRAVANAYNGGTFAVCQWGTMGCTSHKASSASSRYATYRKEIDAGRPIVSAGRGSSSNHYVCVIGYRNGGKKPSDFYILDPADNREGWFGSTWAGGFDSSSYGLQYATFNTKKSASSSGSAAASQSTADHSRSWYTKKYGNEAKVYFAVRDLGYSHKGTCAIMGNINQESGFRTVATSSDGFGSQGLCQWTGDRLTNLKNYAKKHNMAWDSVECQCKFLNKELTDSYKSLKSRLKKGAKSDTLHQLTYDFCFTFERPATWAANMTRRNSSADTYYKRYKKAYGGGGSDSGDEEATGEGVIDMQKRASKLSSAENYEMLNFKLEEEKEEDEFLQKASSFLSNVNFQYVDTSAVPDSIVKVSNSSVNFTQTRTPLTKVNGSFEISDGLIQAPFVELKIGNYTIGSFTGGNEDYPNHVTGMSVMKVNGEINQYTFSIIHQIRPGEDPSVLDKLFSSVRYNKINIRYGDVESGSLFRDIEAIVTNVTNNRNYVGAKISYTLYATSACNYVAATKFNFPATIDRPSSVINKLLYNSGEISKSLQSVFPAMRNQADVKNNGWIPSNDSVLKIDARTNISPLSYLQYLVASMSSVTNAVSDVIRNSSYYLTFDDNANGAYFKITEQANKQNSKGVIAVYNMTIGYPDGNDIVGFTISNDTAWSLLYNTGSVSSEFVYDIDSTGSVKTQTSKSLFNNTQNMSEVQKNWWTQVVSHPIKAQVVMRGLLKPINLMDYINIDVMFYGTKHMTSGLYVVTEQQDILDGGGFKTNLGLVRVGDN